MTTYAILFHGYTGAAWQMASYAKMFYDMGYDVLTPVPFSMLDAVFNACASAEKEKLVVHEAAHGAAADTDPELYWDTVTAFAGKYIFE